jgi:hypothetical protein
MQMISFLGKVGLFITGKRQLPMQESSRLEDGSQRDQLVTKQEKISQIARDLAGVLEKLVENDVNYKGGAVALTEKYTINLIELALTKAAEAADDTPPN